MINVFQAAGSLSLSKGLRPWLPLSRGHVVSPMVRRAESTLAKPFAAEPDFSPVDSSPAELFSAESSSAKPSSAKPSRPAAKPERPAPYQIVYPFTSAEYRDQPTVMRTSGETTSEL